MRSVTRHAVWHKVCTMPLCIVQNWYSGNWNVFAFPLFSDAKSKKAPNAFARNFAAVFLQAGLARASNPIQLVEMFPLALQALRQVSS